MAMPPPPPSMSHPRLEEGLRPDVPGGPPPDEPVSTFVLCMNVINTVTHLLLGAVAFSAFMCVNTMKFVSLDLLDVTKISAHVYLSVIGYVLLVSQAVLSLSPRSGWADNFKYPKKTKIYWSIQVLGSLLAIIGGLLAIVAVGEVSEISIPGLPITIPVKDHLDTPHMIVGLVAMVLTTVSLVGGLAHLICTNMVNSNLLKAVYSGLMTLTLIIAFIAMCLALDEYRSNLLDTSADMAISFAVLAVVGMLAMIIANFAVAGGKGIF